LADAAEPPPSLGHLLSGRQRQLSYSQTDDQVAGVDEPDTVKTNGNIVVTLEGSTLRVLDLQAQVVGSLQLSGDTGGGFLLAGDQALVFSSTSVTGPEPVGFGEPYSTSPEPALPPPMAQVAVVDLSVPTQPRLVRTFLFDGTIVAARLVDGQVRLVLQTDGPRITFVTPSSTGSSAAATAANRALIAGSTLDEWLPEWQIENPDGSTTALQPVASCDSVARPQQASGLSTVSVLSLDPTSAHSRPGNVGRGGRGHGLRHGRPALRRRTGREPPPTRTREWSSTGAAP
jgi:hypothetical protein